MFSFRAPEKNVESSLCLSELLTEIDSIESVPRLRAMAKQLARQLEETRQRVDGLTPASLHSLHLMEKLEHACQLMTEESQLSMVWSAPVPDVTEKHPEPGNDGSGSSSLSSQELLCDLRQAIEANELMVAYQPRVHAESGKLAGCEALVRWNKGGMEMSPVEFIEIAEQSGLINELGEQIIELAMLQTRVWRERGVLDGKMAINLSSSQLSDPVFVCRFSRLLQKTKTLATWFELEIAEDVMLANIDLIQEHIQQLMQLGVTFAIDDVGTKCPSMDYLKSNPVSTLKIDLSLVRGIPGDQRAIRAARSILAFGRELGSSVVAEGVETVEQREFLEQAGCDYLQGFLVGYPMQPEHFENWLHNR